MRLYIFVNESFRIVKEILLNLLISFKLVSNLAKHRHYSGVETSDMGCEKTYRLFTSKIPVNNCDILEIGCGLKTGLLEIAKTNGAESCTAIDIIFYSSHSSLKKKGINLVMYDGEKLPFKNETFDVIWAVYVLEHLRYPEISISEVQRILKPGGHFLARVDLRDHFYLKYPEKWFDCMKYSNRVWQAMTWNRSNFINRLRLNEWLELFSNNHLIISDLKTFEEESLYSINKDKTWAQEYKKNDLTTCRFDIICKKT
jgi:SAM-dependent methyltransferase